MSKSAKLFVIFNLLISLRGGTGSLCALGYEGKLCSVCSKDVDGT